MSDQAFVSLKSLAGRAPSSPAEILAEIRNIYFRTTRQTIQNDLAHAVELLKSLPDEETRERATVYMEGLAQMRREWHGASRKPKVRTQKSEVRTPKSEVRSQKSEDRTRTARVRSQKSAVHSEIKGRK